MSELNISGLDKNFAAIPVLRGINFSVAAGELVAILGASGSGKTTLLRLIAGFLRPDSGTIRLDGHLLADGRQSLPPERRGIGYVAQEGALFPHLSVAENIVFGLPRAQRRAKARVAELLELVGLPEHYANRAPQQLSGGEQQRVALARALAPHPRMLLLDEPFSALDAGLRAETRAAVASALCAANATAILVTHDQPEALAMGSRVGVMQRGVLAQLSVPMELYRRPATPELAAFVGEAVFLPGQALGGSAHTALGVFPLAAPAALGAVRVMLRPEQIRLSTAPMPEAARADVADITYYGPDAMVALRLEAAEAAVSARICGHAVPERGGKVWVTVEGPVMTYPMD
ncbi:ABC transporter ATP-binding protein [Acidocella aromatica]|uniref:Iron(III) transport system ATP-binding protein n=1 Tax=Acidocella aromatica TaxID=1303579 RepID=A0A840V904_9PROT|nr:ABC transporter ATP-binding protein [Acidocella aromatica]MBB5372226.1 iron(III) transport system ATP-binding protein [Acidocella aromatica]